ncbi:MAG: methyltransferase domain-containing protein [Alphaproteobacteria bacterium]|nr:methyltransferase domain-containing protein [Alphaproteobacteria bacterium]
MPKSHERLVEDQFGPRAAAYVSSAVHANGEDLDALEAIIAAAKPASAIDLGAGGGHVAYRMSPHAGVVTAVDLSTEMISAIGATAASRELKNIETAAAPAERLPFGDGRFDFLGCRFSAHHWRDFDGGLREARRVLKAGSAAVFIDGCSPGAAMLDTHLQAVELLRDMSHVRDYTLAEWCAALNQTGFVVRAMRSWRLRMAFDQWIARMQTPEENVRAIRLLQSAASDSVKAHFSIEVDGSFMLDTMMIEAVAA